MSESAPLVDVVVATYDHPRELAETWRALKQRLHYPNLRWVVADDYSPVGVLEFIKAELQPDIIFRTKKRSGIGINVNNALRRLDSDYVFFVEDDRVLRNVHIDLVPGVDLLYHYPEFGMVRYGGIEGHDVTCRLRELEAMPFAVFDRAQMRYPVWELLKNSHTLYVYSGAPHLKHRRFHEAYGLYLEGYKLGVTEEEFCHRFGDMQGPAIVCFPDFVACHFDHIGDSRKLTEDDVGKGYP